MRKTNSLLVSIIMSVYNEESEWIRKAINSILNQTYTNLEVIVVNDNIQNKVNTNLLKEIQHKDNRIQIIDNPTNFGLAKSMNIAIKASQGTYIARMDADDISSPQRIAKQVKYLEQNKEIAVLGTQIKKFGDKNNVKIFPSEPDDLKTKLFFKCCISHPSVMIRKSVVIENKFFYNEDYKSAQDYDLWTRMMLNVKIANLNEVLLHYRVHNKQITHIKRKEQINNTIVSHSMMLYNSPFHNIPHINFISNVIWDKTKFKDRDKQALFRTNIIELIKQNNRVKYFEPFEFNKCMFKTLIRRSIKISYKDLVILKYIIAPKPIHVIFFDSIQKKLQRLNAFTRFCIQFVLYS
ncbi:glycosyltransferase [Halosquirtibacter xylanolyticus]|uniref:glycosyltransferase family 2 protein n=1 Tax=Halosquirtibacter xylanolyticus TaxID=3374599 RepID=UPI0037488BDA|nr:glycosyltransferase [Prolixibacteraceae bacterium]